MPSALIDGSALGFPSEPYANICSMEKATLELLLAQGLSIEKIAKRFRRDPSTVSYWLKVHGLDAPNRERHLAKGGIEQARLEELVDAGLSITRIAETLSRSPGTVRHWLAKFGLETQSTTRRRAAQRARDMGHAITQLECPHHGVTDFWLEGRGAYRCLRCRQAAVARRRRRIKEILVAEAGGSCAICGYSRHVGSLHFHHRDPSQKSFTLSTDGVARSLDRARAEAQKCVLLCSNCHAEVEGGIVSIPA